MSHKGLTENNSQQSMMYLDPLSIQQQQNQKYFRLNQTQLQYLDSYPWKGSADAFISHPGFR